MYFGHYTALFVSIAITTICDTGGQNPSLVGFDFVT